MMGTDPVALEHDLAPVEWPKSSTRCAFCGRPAATDEPEPYPDEVAVAEGYVPEPLATPLAPCCAVHERPCCDVCREVDGFLGHADPR